MRRPLHLVLAALLGGVLAVGASPGAPGALGATDTSGDRSGVVSAAAATTSAEQTRVQAYWTAARMRAAKAGEQGSAFASAAGPARGTSTKIAGTKAKRPTPPGPTPSASITATTGKVFFTLGGVNYVCSGSATSSTNRDVVSTAGHCVNEGPGAFATNWAFVPAYNNNVRPYGTWTARSLVTTSAWANQGDINYDGGFAVMNTLNGAHLTDVVGGQGIAFNLARGLSYTAYGYPAAPPFDGQTLKSCAGTAQNDIYGGTQSQRIPCNMTGGSSGGPWFTGGLQNSLNSFGYNGVKNQMFGPYFGTAIQSAYNTAATR
jgi:hypothetical protein